MSLSENDVSRWCTCLFKYPATSSEFGSARPDGVPVHVHGMDADPIFAGADDVMEEAWRPEPPAAPGSNLGSQEGIIFLFML